MVKLGFAYEHTTSKSKQQRDKNDQHAVRRFVKEEEICLNVGPEIGANTGVSSTKTQCQTCARKHVKGSDCPEKKRQKCFNCKKSRHIKEAPVLKNPRRKRRKSRKIWLPIKRRRKTDQREY